MSNAYQSNKTEQKKKKVLKTTQQPQVKDPSKNGKQHTVQFTNIIKPKYWTLSPTECCSF